MEVACCSPIIPLQDLNWLTLRGNYIEAVPRRPFQYRKRLEKLDLGENFLTSIPEDAFNGTLLVGDLNLDHNYIEELGTY